MTGTPVPEMTGTKTFSGGDGSGSGSVSDSCSGSCSGSYWP